MSPTIFVSGIAGFVGGHTVNNLIKKHPDYKVLGLVRNDEQAKLVKARWPQAETVTGTLDTADILIEQASKADVVIGMLPFGSETLT